MADDKKVSAMGEVLKILRIHVMAEDQPLFERLFRGILEEGWESVRRERDLMLEEERRVGADPFLSAEWRGQGAAEGCPDLRKKGATEEEPPPRPEDYGFPEDWVLL